jgi:hypothetical protein
MNLMMILLSACTNAYDDEAQSFLKSYFNNSTPICGEFKITTKFNKDTYKSILEKAKKDYPKSAISVPPAEQYIECSWMWMSDREYFICNGKSDSYRSFFLTKGNLVQQITKDQLTVKRIVSRPGTINPGDFYLFIRNIGVNDVIAKLSWKKKIIDNGLFEYSANDGSKRYRLIFDKDGLMREAESYNDSQLFTKLIIHTYLENGGWRFPSDAVLTVYSPAGQEIWTKTLTGVRIGGGQKEADKMLASKVFFAQPGVNVHHETLDRATYLKKPTAVQDIIDGKIDYDHRVNAPPIEYDNPDKPNEISAWYLREWVWVVIATAALVCLVLAIYRPLNRHAT